MRTRLALAVAVLLLVPPPGSRVHAQLDPGLLNDIQASLTHIGHAFATCMQNSTLALPDFLASCATVAGFAQCFATEYVGGGGGVTSFGAILQPPLLSAVAIVLAQANITHFCNISAWPTLLGGEPSATFPPVTPASILASFTGVMQPLFFAAPAQPVCRFEQPATGATPAIVFDVTALIGYDRSFPGLFARKTCPPGTPVCLEYRVSPCYSLLCSTNATATSACQKVTETQSAEKSIVSLQLGASQYSTIGGLASSPTAVGDGPRAWVNPPSAGRGYSLTVEEPGESVLTSGLTAGVMDLIQQFAQFAGINIPLNLPELQAAYADNIRYTMRTTFVCDPLVTGPAVLQNTTTGRLVTGAPYGGGDQPALAFGYVYDVVVVHACACPNSVCAYPPLPETDTATQVTIPFTATAFTVVVSLLIVLMFLLERRRHVLVGFWGAHPGIAIPVNHLEGRKHRFFGAAVFTAFSVLTFLNVFDNFFVSYTDSSQVRKIFSSFILMWYSIFYPVMMSPIFLALYSNQPWLARPVGLLFALAISGILANITHIGLASSPSDSNIVLGIMSLFCTLVAFGAACCLGYLAVTAIHRRWRACHPAPESAAHSGAMLGITNDDDLISETSELVPARRLQSKLASGSRIVIARARRLFALEETDGMLEYRAGDEPAEPAGLFGRLPSTRAEDALALRHLHIYENHVRALLQPSADVQKSALQAFRFNGRLVTAAGITLSWLALILALTIFATNYLCSTDFFFEFFHGQSRTDCDEAANADGSATFGSAYEQSVSIFLSLHLSCATTRIIVKATTGAFIAAFIIGTIIQCVFVYFTFFAYRENVLALHRGDRRHLPLKSLPTTQSINNGLKLGGYLVAYTIVGWLLASFVFIVLFLFITFAIVLPMPVDGLRVYDASGFWLWVLNFTAPVVCVLIINTIQSFVVGLVFSIDKERIGVKNRRIFHLLDYLLFLYNIMNGLLSFLGRMGKSIAFNIFFVTRLDKCIMTSGWEYWDTAYTCFVGSVMLDATYSNPVMLTFIRILLNQQPAAAFSSRPTNSAQTTSLRAPLLSMTMSAKQNDTNEEETQKRRQARIRWFLAITLHNNPGLRSLRRPFTSETSTWYVPLSEVASSKA